MKKREEKYVKDRNMSFNVLPQFIEIFRGVETYSSKSLKWHTLGTNGRFHQLVKNSRKRRDDHIEEEKKGEEFTEMRAQVHTQENLIWELKSRLDHFEKDQDYNLKNEEALHKLFEMGIIDEKGELTNNRDDDM